MIVATAGHVDHGKSTLVRQLTGVDPDRWPEEQVRGLTIGLGFATCALPSGRVASFVDVPGHHRFLPTMLAGAGGAAVSLLVVSATEGWREQTDEHVRILRHLGVPPAVVAVTFADRCDPAPVAADVARRLPAAAVAGVDDVLVALDAAPVVGAVDAGRPRLWVDRSFTVRGAGAVVTGSLRDGSLAVGDEVVLEPGGRRARVRGLQEHGHEVERIGPGRRAAVRLAGVSHHDTGRGDVLVRPGEWAPVDAVDVDLTVDPAHRPPVGRRGAWLAYVGTAEHAVRVSGPPVAPGTTGRVRLRLPVALPLADGDAVILRDAGRGETVGGGPVSLLPISSSGRLPGSRPGTAPEPEVETWLEAMRVGGLAPPAVPGEVIRVLATQRRIVGGDGVWFHPNAVDEAARRVRAMNRESAVTVGEVREALGTNRRRALALLGLLDAAGVTRRAGERRTVRD